jgi:hypothetical protein
MTSPSQPPNKKVKLTPLAKKYGLAPLIPAIDTHNLFVDSGKSGLTPIVFRPDLSYEDYTRLRLMEEYQLFRFQLFTARELEAMQAFAPLDETMKPGNLDLPIHPLYQQHRWDTRDTLPLHLGRYQLGMGLAGYWEVCRRPFVS